MMEGLPAGVGGKFSRGAGDSHRIVGQRPVRRRWLDMQKG